MTFIKFLESYEKKIFDQIEKSRKGLVVTVSGLAGSGKTETARLIARNLSLEYHSSGSLMRKIADEKGFRLEELCRVRDPGIDYEIDRETLRLAAKGNIVLDGRLTGWVAGNLATMRVFVFCPPEIRAVRVEKRDGMIFDNAMKHIFERDMADRKKYMNLYGIDMIDQSIYDKIIDNSGPRDELEKKVESIARNAKAI